MSGSPASQRRRAFIERIERLEEERKTLADDIASVYDELKADGHDKAAVKIIVKIRRKEDGLAKWVGYSGTVDEYLADLGMLPKLEEARAGARVRENIEEIGAEINRQIASGEIVAVAQTGELTDTQEQPETATQSQPIDTVHGSGAAAKGLAGPACAETANTKPAPNSPSPETPQATADDEAAQANPTSSAPISNPQPAASLGNADKAGAASSSTAPATLSEKKDCLKLKDGHCKISFDTPALCAVYNAERMKARAVA